jgi:hypothetical protein
LVFLISACPAVKTPIASLHQTELTTFLPPTDEVLTTPTLSEVVKDAAKMLR